MHGEVEVRGVEVLFSIRSRASCRTSKGASGWPVLGQVAWLHHHAPDLEAQPLENSNPAILGRLSLAITCTPAGAYGCAPWWANQAAWNGRDAIGRETW